MNGKKQKILEIMIGIAIDEPRAMAAAETATTHALSQAIIAPNDANGAHSKDLFHNKP